MSIVARRGRVLAEPRSRLLRYDRPMPVAVAASAIGSPAAAAATPDRDDPRHELARLALDVVVRTSEPISVARAWTSVPFRREVEWMRAQLAPIRTRPSLSASFSREASVAVTRSSPDDAAPRISGPVRVAYASRWLELGDDRSRPDWLTIVIGAATDPLLAQRIGDSTR